MDYRILLFCLLIFATINGLVNKYYHLNCEFGDERITHTVCEREKERCGAGPLCGPDFKIIKLNDNMRQLALDLHNYFRNKVALGNEIRGGKQPSAANMKIMKYNRELEFIAQCWANTCNGNPLIHDHCRSTENYEHVGQNLGFVNSSVNNILVEKSVVELVRYWYDEVAIFKNDWVNDTQDRGPEIKVGHYTQMIWADTSEVGCAATSYTTKTNETTKWYHLIFICNYGPGGNYLGLPIYEVGKPASKCEENLKRNNYYKGLCGKTININETDFESIYQI